MHLVVELTEGGAGMKAILCVAMLAAGCASHPVPTLQLTASDASIERASAAGGLELAGGDLQSAREKIELARHLSTAHANEPARWLAEQAQVDAELAGAKASALRALGEAERWQDSVRALRAGLAPTPTPDLRKTSRP